MRAAVREKAMQFMLPRPMRCSDLGLQEKYGVPPRSLRRWSREDSPYAVDKAEASLMAAQLFFGPCVEATVVRGYADRLLQATNGAAEQRQDGRRFSRPPTGVSRVVADAIATRDGSVNREAKQKKKAKRRAAAEDAKEKKEERRQDAAVAAAAVAAAAATAMPEFTGRKRKGGGAVCATDDDDDVNIAATISAAKAAVAMAEREDRGCDLEEGGHWSVRPVPGISAYKDTDFWAEAYDYLQAFPERAMPWELPPYVP
jgi:hypothetical protein